MGDRRRSRLGTVLRLLLATLATLALLEVGARLLLPERSYEAWRRSSLRYTYQPFFHWSLRPGEYRSPGGPITINSHGLRGAEIALEKEPGEIRVLVLGGSAAFNYHAAGGWTWPRRLEAYLRGRLGAGVRVINGGTPGYSSYESSVRYQRELVDFAPDLVLVYHLWNDLKMFSIEDADEAVARWDRHGRSNEASTLLDPFPFLDVVCLHSQFVTHARFANLALLRLLRGIGEEGPVEIGPLDRRITREGVDFFRANLARIAGTSASRGIPFGIIDQPSLAKPRSGRRERRRIRYEYTGFDHPTLLEAVRVGLGVNRQVASRPGGWHLPTAGFPNDLAHMRDHVHLTDRGLARLVEILGPRVVEILRAAASPGPTGGDDG